MATRATYQIEISETEAVVFYVHTDGYPAGAAEKLIGVVSPADFKARNPRAEVVRSAEECSDTDYRYVLTLGGEVVALKRSWHARTPAPSFAQIFRGNAEGLASWANSF